MSISKRDIVRMSHEQIEAGKRMWDVTSQAGRMASSSFDAESNAPKTWILYANNKGEEISTVECEVYTVGRASDPSEGLVMLVGMCPKCGENFTAREDNKTMSVERVSYRQAPKHIKVNWQWHCKNVLGRRFSEEDEVIVVSSPERWACDYCKGWCVRVNAGVAVDDHRGVTQFTVGPNIPIIDPGDRSGEIIF